MSRTVVITGANRGLGLELARAHHALGDTVIGTCRTPGSAAELAAVADEVHACDTADMASIAALGQVLAGRTVDVLYNSAGVDGRSFGADDAARTILTVSPEVFESVMRVNVTGPVATVQALLPNLKAAKGRVVNVSSQIGSMEIGRTMGRDGAYAASKSALNMVTLKQAQMLSPDGVTVICIHPGWLQTEMGGSAATLAPSEAAASIAKMARALTIEQTGSFLRWDGTVHPW